MTIWIKRLLLFLLVILLTGNMSFGQPPPPSGPPCWPPPCSIPFDGGISLLILAGAAYGGKKLYNKRLDQNA